MAIRTKERHYTSVGDDFTELEILDDGGNNLHGPTTYNHSTAQDVIDYFSAIDNYGSNGGPVRRPQRPGL